MPDNRDFRRRVIGVLFLCAAVAMLVAGETLLREPLRLHPEAFLVFWMVCFVLLGLAVLVAILDLAIVRHRVRQEQRELLQNTIHDIEQNRRKFGKSKSSDKSPK